MALAQMTPLCGGDVAQFQKPNRTDTWTIESGASAKIVHRVYDEDECENGRNRNKNGD